MAETQTTEVNAAEALQIEREGLQAQNTLAEQAMNEAASGISDLKASNPKNYRKSPAYPILESARVKEAKVFERTQRRLDRIDEVLATEQYVAPLIDGFGSVTVDKETKLPARVALSDVQRLRDYHQARVDAAQEVVNVYGAIQDGVKLAEITAESVEKMRPVSFVRNDNGTVTLAVAKGRGGGGGGGPRTLYRVNGVQDARVKALVGKTVGPQGDYASFKAVAMEFASPDELGKLIGTTANGNPKSRSARNFCESVFGMVVVPA